SNDGGGGGGAGGSIILVTRTGSWSSIAVSARGGDGSNAGSGTSIQGPGGGGGGGVILANAPVGSSDTSGGAAGLTDKGTDPNGATSGPGGTGAPGTGGNPLIDAGDIPGSTPGSECGLNAAPVAGDDAYFVAAGATLNVPAPGVLGNDTDAEGTALTASLVSGPVAGSLTLNVDGSFSFDSTGVMASSVTFTYTASDGTASSNVAVVTVTIGNSPPVASDDTGSVSEDAPLVVSAPGLLGNDTDANGDPLTTTLVAGPTNGTLTLGTDGSYTYTPNADFHGTDGFTYQANDGQAASVTASVVITVTAVNDLPAAADDSFEAVQNSSLVDSIGVLANDTDADGESLAAVLVAGPSHGALTLSPDGSFTYTPDFAFVGTDAFTYQASDGKGPSNVATATILVAARSRSDSLKAGYCSAAVGEPGAGAGAALLLGAALVGLLAVRRRAARGGAALLLLACAATAAQAQDAAVPSRLVLQEEEKPAERPTLEEPTTTPGHDLLDFGRLEGGVRVGVVGFSHDFESDPQAAGGILLRAPSPWVSQDLVGLDADDIGFYLDVTISRIDRDLDFLDENDGTLVFVGAGTDITLVRDETWHAAFQAGLQYGWFGDVDETAEGIAVALGLFGGVQVASSFWITVNPQIAFADAGDQIYFLHVGAHLAF
ncbi:MAG TPA: Ig-like domain-containing protein, partial [Planctomycetota bacterium]|nr:Ig-like domain-containing protein [Planctomycetota bacterium]